MTTRVPTSEGAIYAHPERVAEPREALFDPAHWRGHGRVTEAAAGRGSTWFIDTGDGRRWVLRGYRRGGQAARISERRYLFTGEQRTRVWREWQVLNRLEQAGLPAPRPVAARYRRRGLTYTADILTERIPDADSLSAILRARALPPGAWRRIGACIAAFHRDGVHHADLNAHNILLDNRERVFLIDFDRARLGVAPDRCRANLDRLARSLRKLAHGAARFHCVAADWDALRDGYRGTGDGRRETGDGR